MTQPFCKNLFLNPKISVSYNTENVGHDVSNQFSTYMWVANSTWSPESGESHMI